MTLLVDLSLGSLSRQIFYCRDKFSVDFSSTLLSICHDKV